MTRQQIKIIAFYINFLFLGLTQSQAAQYTANMSRATLKKVNETINENLKDIESLSKDNIINFLLCRNMPTVKNNFYIISQQKTNYYKLGISHDVQTRLRQLQTGNPNELKIIFNGGFYLCEILEKCIFKILQKNCIFGEWYELEKPLINKQIKILNKLITKV
jgi:hypothetical protein